MSKSQDATTLSSNDLVGPPSTDIPPERYGENRRVIAFIAGRHFARARFHLKQGVLIYPTTVPLLDPPTATDSAREEASSHHIRRGRQLVDAALSRSVSFNGAQIQDVMARWSDSLWPEGLGRTIHHWKQRISPDDSSVLTPQYCAQAAEEELNRGMLDRVRQLLVEAMEHEAPFALGECLEEAMCRFDVHRYMTQGDCWPVLKCAAPAINSNCSSLARRVFEPGDIAAADAWPERLRTRWLAALPEGTCLDSGASCLEPMDVCLTSVRPAIGNKRRSTTTIRRAVSNLHVLACRGLIEATPSVERITVDVNSHVATVDGTLIPLDPEFARILKRYWDARQECAGNHCVSEATLRDEGFTIGNFARDIRNHLKKKHPTLARLLISVPGPGGGIRLR